MDSFQITTSPLLRQFATRLDPQTIQVTTKLGVATIIRADFDPVSFPADEVKWTHRSRQFFSEFKLRRLLPLQLVGAAP
ncbi:hypothetical protein [Pseudomonas aeruginosa]|uniref:hypothetical protein n=1 Tax=Pseudomonas aeruginosa TaxID=287 RepID=UPI003F83191B